MSLKGIAAKLFAKYIQAKTKKWAAAPRQTQEKTFSYLIKQGSNTAFGKDHNFQNITSYSDFKQKVPVRDYEGLKTYFERMAAGEADVLWPGKPIYIAKTSGTTSGAKYIPLTKESLPYHIKAARNAILLYVAETGNTSFVDGKMIFLQGSPVMEEKNGIKIGRLSGIVAHYVPNYLQTNRLPSWETNCMEDWEKKVDAIVEETKNENMTVISGIPPWVQMYFEKLQESTGKKIGELFNNFSLHIYGGVNFEPYRAKFEDLIGRKVDGIELYPASEGFFAFQDSQQEKGMLLQLNSGMFYEFVKTAEYFDENFTRLRVHEVETGVDYVMIVSTNAGLWAYNLGDTVQFTSLKPYRLIVSGRIKHFISAFGEHVIGKEVDQALQNAVNKSSGIRVSEFTVAPNITPEEGGSPYHQWFIEFENSPEDLQEFAMKIDEELQIQNSYYKDLIQGKILQPLKIKSLPKEAFKNYMRSKGKLGGQNKLPRLSNDRNIAEDLLKSNM